MNTGSGRPLVARAFFEKREKPPSPKVGCAWLSKFVECDACDFQGYVGILGNNLNNLRREGGASLVQGRLFYAVEHCTRNRFTFRQNCQPAGHAVDHLG